MNIPKQPNIPLMPKPNFGKATLDNVFERGLQAIKEEAYREGYNAGRDDKYYFSEEFLHRIYTALIEEGQYNSSKYGFKLGDTIKFTPDEVVDIIKKRLSEDRKDDVFDL